MRQFVHTPKNGIKLPLDTSQIIGSLKEQKFLMFEPTNRPTVHMQKKVDEEYYKIDHNKQSMSPSSPSRNVSSPTRNVSSPAFRPKITLTLG